MITKRKEEEEERASRRLRFVGIHLFLETKALGFFLAGSILAFEFSQLPSRIITCLSEEERQKKAHKAFSGHKTRQDGQRKRRQRGVYPHPNKHFGKMGIQVPLWGDYGNGASNLRPYVYFEQFEAAAGDAPKLPLKSAIIFLPRRLFSSARE